MIVTTDREAIGTVDFDNPPAEAPPHCIDPVMWRIAHYLFGNHAPGNNGECARCSGAFPCLGRTLAQTGLRTAMGETNEDSDYWRGYARLHGPVG
jgi:hypothetical protein